MKNKEKLWSLQIDDTEDYWVEECRSHDRNELIRRGSQLCKKLNKNNFQIAEVLCNTPPLDFEDILQVDRLEFILGENSDKYLEDLYSDTSNFKDLENKVNNVIKEWLDKHGLTPIIYCNIEDLVNIFDDDYIFISENLDTPMNTLYKDCDNTQTFRQFITESEEYFEMDSADIDNMLEEDLVVYINMLDDLWSK